MTTNPPGNGDRLDRIEALLAALAERQADTQTQLEQERQNRLAFRTDYEGSITDLVTQLSDLRTEVSTLTANVNAYIAQSTAFLASEQRDRAQFRSAMVGLQTETRNILQELADMRRQPNNGGEA